jgi:hypothetical protein
MSSGPQPVVWAGLAKGHAKGGNFLIHSNERVLFAGTDQAKAGERRLMQYKFGEWLSLVEHLVRDQGVGGSNPLSPTIYFNNLANLLNSSEFLSGLNALSW